MQDGRAQLIDEPPPRHRREPSIAPVGRGAGVDSGAGARAARRALREQIARLERQLADAFVTAFPSGGLEPAPAPLCTEPRLLDLRELEIVRDELTQRLHAAHVTLSRRADAQADSRLLLQRMLLDPGRHRFARVWSRDVGEPGCGVWQVRPRLGLVGMLMGWWRVTLSSGCPLAGGRRPVSGPARS